MRQSVRLLSLLFAIALVHSAAGSRTATLVARRHRCQRPFSTRNPFASAITSSADENCNFNYFRVVEAHAALHCWTAGQKGNGADAASLNCNVTLSLTMQTSPDAWERLVRSEGAPTDYFLKQDNGPEPLLPQVTQEQKDPWRYSLALCAKGDSEVHYKGFDGEGYSMCCGLIDEASCTWAPAQTPHTKEGEGMPALIPVVEYCPLPIRDSPLEETEDPHSRNAPVTFHGTLTKPLHRVVSGEWEARMMMWRLRRWYSCTVVPDEATDAAVEGDPNKGSDDPEMLGRVVVPFKISLEDVSREAHVTAPPRTTPLPGDDKSVVSALLPHV